MRKDNPKRTLDFWLGLFFPKKITPESRDDLPSVDDYYSNFPVFSVLNLREDAKKIMRLLAKI